MFIVNRKTFLAMPEGTVFAKYEPCIFGELMVKGETWTNDFLYQSFGWIDTDGEPFVVLSKMEKSQVISCPVDVSTRRDGLFDEDQLFAIYENEDIRAIVNALTSRYALAFVLKEKVNDTPV